MTRRAALSLVLGLLALMAACALLGWLAQGPTEAAGRALLATAGPAGVLLGVTLAEWCPVPPLAGEPVLVLAWRGGLPLAQVVALGVAGNLLAAALCYPCGALLRRAGLVERALGARRAEAEALVARHGPWALVLASFSPLPFATLAWVAGAMRMPLGRYALACAVRIPKVIVYLTVIVAGWRLGG